jgi:hypothetical protein
VVKAQEVSTFNMVHKVSRAHFSITKFHLSSSYTRIPGSPLPISLRRKFFFLSFGPEMKMTTVESIGLALLSVEF